MAEKLAVEKDLVLNQKAAYEQELDVFERNKRDYEFEASVVNSETLRVQEMEQELK